MYKQVDWHSALRDDVGIINDPALFDFNRKIIGEAYKLLITDWKDILARESYGLQYHQQPLPYKPTSDLIMPAVNMPNSSRVDRDLQGVLQ